MNHKTLKGHTFNFTKNNIFLNKTLKLSILVYSTILFFVI